MRGHLTERRPDVWRLVVSDGFDEAGRRRQIVRTVKGSKRDAQRALTRMLKDRDDGRLAAGRQLLGRYLEQEWLPAVSAVSKRGRPLAPTTEQRYRDTMRHVSGQIGKIRLSDLRPAHVERLRDALLATLAPQTVADILRVLAQALSRAEARGLVGRNPAAPELVHRPVGEKPRFTVIDARLGKEILGSVIGKDPWDAAVHLALGLGLRREEVLGLRWEDAGETVRIRRALTYAGGKLHFGPPKSTAGERELQVPAFVSAALRRHKAAQAERLLLVGRRSELVVDQGDGEPWMPASFSTGWRRFAANQGLAGITFHALRHGAATLLLASGVPDAVAVHVMGHADSRVLRRYQEVVPDLLRDAAARMEAVLGPV